MANPQSEPSMDEILASIRRIIAEEDEPTSAPPSVAEPLDLKKEAAISGVKNTQDVDDVSLQASHVVPEADVTQQVSALQAAMQAAKPLDTSADEGDFVTDEPQAVNPVEEVEFENFGFDAAEMEKAAPTAPTAPQRENASSEVISTFEIRQEALEIDAVTSVSQPNVVQNDQVEKNISEGVLNNYAPEILERVQDSMLSKASAGAATTAFEALAENVRISDGPGKTMEGLIKEMVEPMLRQWLDQNLPRIVEDKVEEEVRRLARHR